MVEVVRQWAAVNAGGWAGWIALNGMPDADFVEACDVLDEAAVEDGEP